MGRWHRRGLAGTAVVGLVAIVVGGMSAAVGADGAPTGVAADPIAAYNSQVTVTLGAVDSNTSAQQLWATRGPASYRYVWVTSAMVGTSRASVEVRDRRVVSQVPLAGPTLRPEARAAPTIDDVFERLRAAQEQADQVQTTYDAVWGYPSSVQVDKTLDAADDEYGFGVENFQPS